MADLSELSAWVPADPPLLIPFFLLEQKDSNYVSCKFHKFRGFDLLNVPQLIDLPLDKDSNRLSVEAHLFESDFDHESEEGLLVVGGVEVPTGHLLGLDFREGSLWFVLLVFVCVVVPIEGVLGLMGLGMPVGYF